MPEGSTPASAGSFDLRKLGLMSGPPDRGFAAVTRTMSRALGVSGATVSILDFARNMMMVRASEGLPSGVPHQYEVPFGISLCRRVFDARGPVNSVDMTNDPAFSDCVHVREMGVVAFVAAPVYCPAEEIVGALVGFEYRPRIWSQSDTTVLADLAALATQAITLRAALATVSILSSAGV